MGFRLAFSPQMASVPKNPALVPNSMIYFDVLEARARLVRTQSVVSVEDSKMLRLFHRRKPKQLRRRALLARRPAPAITDMSSLEELALPLVASVPDNTGRSCRIAVFPSTYLKLVLNVFGPNWCPVS